MNDTDDEGNCSSTSDQNVFNTYPYFVVTMLSAATALVSMFACLVVVVLVFALKKYYFFTQRLILYLSLAALLDAISIALRLQLLGPEVPGLCMFTAFVDQITAWAELIAICCITLNLLLLVIYRLQTAKFELLFVFMIFIFPLTFNWIPFIKGAYWRAGAWCWIRSKNDDCSRFVFGTVLRFILWWIPLYVILVTLIITYCVIIYHMRKKRHTWEGKYDPESTKLQKMMAKEVRPLLWYPLIYFVINIFPLINRIYDTISPEPELALWILHAIFSPLQGGFIALAFTLDKETLKRLNRAQIRATFFQGIQRQPSAHEYPATKPRGYTDSFQPTNAGRGGRYNGVEDMTPYVGVKESDTADSQSKMPQL